MANFMGGMKSGRRGGGEVVLGQKRGRGGGAAADVGNVTVSCIGFDSPLASL